MPKEVIYGSGIPYGTPEEPLAHEVVELTWSRDHETVQLATRCVNPVDGAVYEGEERDQDFVGQDIPRAFGNYVTLDRWAINRLIRHLRRARDTAFGRDE